MEIKEIRKCLMILDFDEQRMSSSGVEAYTKLRKLIVNEMKKGTFGGKKIEKHLCPYCRENYNDSSDPKILCKGCREDFGHHSIDEL